MADDTAPDDAAERDPVMRSVRNEQREQDAQPDLPTVEPGPRPPGHPAQDDDAFSVGEAANRPGPVPGEAGRPGRPGRPAPPEAERSDEG